MFWQFIAGPAWIVIFSWNFQRFLARYFSAPVMLKTLGAHWHKDAVVYHGSLADKAKILAWNLISRVIGFIARTIVLAAWLLVAAAAYLFLGVFLVIFILWPFIMAGTLVWGVMNL